MTPNSIPIDVLRQLIAADFKTGELTWLSRPVSLFKVDGKRSQQHNCNLWNSKYAGKPAFTAKGNGYLHGGLFDITYRAHRIIWALYTGHWPVEKIDHINGKKSDNRIINLREATQQQNGFNCGQKYNNTTGKKGVNKHKEQWRASITVNRHRIYLGLFNTIEKAHAAYCVAAKKYHGEFANFGK